MGRVVSTLLDYVGQVSLCSKLTKILEGHTEWPHIHRITRESQAIGYADVHVEAILPFLFYLQKTIFLQPLRIPTAVLCDPGNPRCLFHLSRVVIRKHLRCSDMLSLQLPNRLKDYLLFRESDLYATITCRDR